MWIDPIITLNLIAKGLVVGIIASAPMGPVGVLTVQRTLNKGRWYGFVTGAGASMSDIIYALISGLGLSIVLDFVERGSNMIYMKLLGSAMLFVFGTWAFRSKPALRPAARQKGTLAHNCFTGFLITLSNPLIVFLFLALFTRFDFVVDDHPIEQALGYLGIVGGAMLWWTCLTGIVDKARARFKVETIGLLNKVLGVIVMVSSLVGVVITLFY